MQKSNEYIFRLNLKVSSPPEKDSKVKKEVDKTPEQLFVNVNRYICKRIYEGERVSCAIYDTPCLTFSFWNSPAYFKIPFETDIVWERNNFISI